MTKTRKSKNIDTSIFNNINVGIYRNTPGPTGKFIEVNNSLVKMFGYASKEEFLKKVRPADTYVDPLERKSFSDLLKRRGFVKRERLVLRKKDGTVAFAQVTATAVKDRFGKIKWFDGIIEDITEVERQ